MNTRPLVQELIPVARDLSPTLKSVRELSPHLRNLFVDLDDLQRVSETGLPALRKFLDGLAPVLDSLDPFLANLNPVIRYLEFQKASITDFLVGPAAALSGSYEPVAGDPAPRRGLRQLSYLGQRGTSASGRRGWRPTAATATSSRACSMASARRRAGSSRTSTARTPTTGGRSGGRADPDEDEVRIGAVRRGHQQGDPPGVTPRQFAPCFIAGDFANDNDFQAAQNGTFGDGRFPEVFADP